MTERFRTPYPGWDILAKWDTVSYNAQTREVLRGRLDPPRPRALPEPLYAALEALCETVIPHAEAARAWIAPWIDAAIAEGRPTGTRYVGMPGNPTAWRQGLAAFDAESRSRYGAGFAELRSAGREAVLKAVDAGEVEPEVWHGLIPQKFLRHIALKQIVELYYSLPVGQSEIGYGGPASPRGYVRLGPDRLDAWEAPEGEWPT